MFGNKTGKFRARFMQRFGKKNDWEIKDVMISYEELKERGLKPPNVFIYKKGNYLYNPEAIRKYDSNGYPILKYYLDNVLPIIEGKKTRPYQITIDKQIINVPVLEEEYDIPKESGIEQNAQLFDKTFTRGEMKETIAASQKEPQKWDWLTLVIGIGMGVAIGIIIGIVIYPYMFPHAMAATTTQVTTH